MVEFISLSYITETVPIWWPFAPIQLQSPWKRCHLSARRLSHLQKNKQKLLYIWTKHKKRNIKQEHKYVYVLNIVFDVYITWTRTRRRRSPAWRRSTTRVWRCCTFQWLNVAFYIWTSDAVSAFGSNFYLFLHL